MRLTLSIAVCCLMTACAAGLRPTSVEQTKILPPANATAPPQPLPPPRSGAMRDLEANHLEVTRLYHQLAASHCSLLQWLGINDDACRPYLDGGAPGATR